MRVLNRWRAKWASASARWGMAPTPRASTSSSAPCPNVPPSWLRYSLRSRCPPESPCFKITQDSTGAAISTLIALSLAESMRALLRRHSSASIASDVISRYTCRDIFRVSLLPSTKMPKLLGTLLCVSARSGHCTKLVQLLWLGFRS